MEHFDLLIVGAGLSGIGAAVHLQRDCPGRSFAILEGRAALGGTWDLFRYPGIRSDSDMYTLGYAFKPWTDARSIADGPAILKYIADTAREHGLEQHIRLRHRVGQASWSGADARWTLDLEIDTDTGSGTQRTARQISCAFLFVCGGYYNYAHGYAPEFPGIARFTGRVVHPQHWPADLDYAGQRVVVIGSGATAVTLVPAMAGSAAHVTMLQRSPTYVVSLPGRDRLADWLNRHLPASLAYGITRWKNVLFGMAFFNFCRRWPQAARKLILSGVRKQMRPDFDVQTHFNPRYNPWEQRLCLVPDADLFKAIRKGRASVVTDHVECFTEHGIRLRSGRELPADLVVTATGLELQALGGIALRVDARPVVLNQTMSYKGMMLSDVPNLAYCIGYTNASWTLKADLSCGYVCRLLNHMERLGARQCTPRRNDPSVLPAAWIDFSSGYIQRSLDRFPKLGSKHPWRLHQNYARDLMLLRYGRVDDGTMEFS